MGVPDARKTDESELRNMLDGTGHGIRWRERDMEKGRKVQNKMRKGERCGTYIVGVKDLASAYVLCPRLAEYRGLLIYGRTGGGYGITKGL